MHCVYLLNASDEALISNFIDDFYVLCRVVRCAETDYTFYAFPKPGMVYD